MNIDPVWQAFILGILQGLTEFLPISSSAHLILLPWFAGWEAMGIAFDVVIHGGTILAVLIYFSKDWKLFILSLVKRIRGHEIRSRERALVDSVIVGTIPAVLVGLLFRDLIEEYAREPLVTVFTLTLFGILLWGADAMGLKTRAFEGLTLRDGILVGMAQALALIPGVSRSGITITAALFLGFKRPDSARLSFLLAGPVIAVGALDGIWEMLMSPPSQQLGIGVVLTGVLTSLVVGLLCIKYFLRFVSRWTYVPFVVYRVLLASAILTFWVLQFRVS